MGIESDEARGRHASYARGGKVAWVRDEGVHVADRTQRKSRRRTGGFRVTTPRTVRLLLGVVSLGLVGRRGVCRSSGLLGGVLGLVGGVGVLRGSVGSVV